MPRVCSRPYAQAGRASPAFSAVGSIDDWVEDAAEDDDDEDEVPVDPPSPRPPSPHVLHNVGAVGGSPFMMRLYDGSNQEAPTTPRVKERFVGDKENPSPHW